MTPYSVILRERIVVKGYEFLSFAKSKGKNVCKNTTKNISKNLNGKYSQNVFDYAKQSATDSFKTSS